MDVILTQDVEKLGKKGEVVKVKDGFFRNYLFPRNQAIVSNTGNLRTLELRKAREAAKEKEEKDKCQELAKKIGKLSLTISAQVGEEDKLFGTVTTQQIADALKEEGFAVEKKKIVEEEPIKKTGSYAVKIKLHPEVECSLKLKVVKGA